VTVPGQPADGRIVLGQWLRYLRDQAGLTQEAVADAARYSREAVTRAENYGDGGRDLFAAAGELLGCGDWLALFHDLITAAGAAPAVLVPGLAGPLVTSFRVPLVLLPAVPEDSGGRLCGGAQWYGIT
jgi:Helix-turn-helix domain